MGDLKYCKLCLITDVKMYSITVTAINKAYSQLLQMPVSDFCLQFFVY